MTYEELRTPSYIVLESKLKQNLEILSYVSKCSGGKILLAQKAFSMFRVYPLIAEYLTGTTASGIYEARLAHEEMPGSENHVFEPAYKDDEMEEILHAENPALSFTKLWTQKEAVVKLTGHGISDNMKSVLTSFAGEIQTTVTDNYVYSITY